MKTKLMKVGKNENAEITVREAGAKFGVYLVGPHRLRIDLTAPFPTEKR